MAARQSFLILGSALAGLVMATNAYADDVQAEQVEAKTGAEEPLVSVSLIGTYQSASDSRVNDEAALRPEVFITLPVAGLGGELHVHVEGTTTPRSNSVTSFLGNSNTNIGTATNSAGHGRLQHSELYYEFEGGSITYNVGLLDTTGFLDTSAFAGDERTQFMNWSLVHNTTIEFPDYTLGAAMSTQSDGAMPGIVVVLGASNGLGDNQSKTYPELFDVRSNGQGLFAGAELGWGLQALGDEGAAKIGIWTNTADHTYLDLRPGTSSNKGVYGVLEGTALNTGWSLRAGKADSDVSQADWFVGGALQRQLADQVVAGLGVTRTNVSSKLGAGFSDMTEAELYVKYDVMPHVALTPSVQWVKNPGFDGSGATVDANNWVFGMRIAFEM